MPSGKYRSRRFVRKNVRLPGKDNTVHYRKRKPKKAHCSNCGAVLGGISNERDAIKRNLAKSKKRPTRPYGGVLCPGCLKLKIRKAMFMTDI